MCARALTEAPTHGSADTSAQELLAVTSKAEATVITHIGTGLGTPAEQGPRSMCGHTVAVRARSVARAAAAQWWPRARALVRAAATAAAETRCGGSRRGIGGGGERGGGVRRAVASTRPRLRMEKYSASKSAGPLFHRAPRGCVWVCVKERSRSCCQSLHHGRRGERGGSAAVA